MICRWSNILEAVDASYCTQSLELLISGHSKTHNASRSIHLSESCPPHNIAVNSPAFDEWDGIANEKQCSRIKCNARKIGVE